MGKQTAGVKDKPLQINCRRKRYKCELVVEDTEDALSTFQFMEQYGAAADQVYAWLSAGKNVLVHCEYGQSRSPAIIACLFMKYRNMSLTKAMNLIFKRRRIVRTLKQTHWKRHLENFQTHWRQHAAYRKADAKGEAAKQSPKRGKSSPGSSPRRSKQ